MKQTHLELLDELHQLLKKFCEISSTHHEYASNLSKGLNESIEKAIRDEFETLYELHTERLTASTGIELYSLQTKNGMTIPQRRRHWYSFWRRTPNPAAKYVEGEIYGNSELFFDDDLVERTKEITELKQLLEQAQAAQIVPSAASEEPPEAITLPPQPGSPAAQLIVKREAESAQEEPAPSPAAAQEEPVQNVQSAASEETPALEEAQAPQQAETPTAQTHAPSPATAQEEVTQTVQSAASEETPASEETQASQQNEAHTVQAPTQPTVPVPEKPNETWEEEHAIPSETLTIPSEG